MKKNYQGKLFELKSIMVTAFIVFAMTGFTSIAADEENLVIVKIDRSLMNSQAGIEEIHKKLKAHTRKSCQRSNLSANAFHEGIMCNKEVLARLVASVNDQRLTHYVKTGQHLKSNQTIASN